MKNFRPSAKGTVAVDRADALPVLDLDVNVVDFESVVESISKLRSMGGGYVCVANVHMVMEAHDSPDYRQKVNSADLVVPDGMPLVWMQKMQGRSDAVRVRGNDLMTGILSWASDNGVRIGFLGGSSSVIDGIRERAVKDFPGIMLSYLYSPPFRTLTVNENQAIVREINEANVDILFVGLGCPKQEIWMADHRKSLECVSVGVGAAFDFYAGNIRESPRWMGRLGLEWLFRLMREPKRLWRRYLMLNPRFIFLAMKQLAQRTRGLKH